MERNEAGQPGSLQPGAKDRHHTILAQLLPAMERMQHIDDVFLWLANKMMRYLSIDVLQIWTVQITDTQQIIQTLRGSSMQDSTIPQHVVMNSNIAETIVAIARNRQNITTRAVGDIFSYHHANLLKRYGLYHCTGCLLISNTSIPSPKGQELMISEKTPSTIVTLAILKQPGSQDLVPTITLLLEQALAIAESRGLLSVSSVNESSSLISTPQSASPLISTSQSSLQALYELIPRRTRSNTSMRSSSPFNSASPISNKSALTFYGAIDGTKTIAEIASAKKMSAKEITTAVQTLLQEKRIQLYTKEGQLVDSEMLLRSI